MRHTVVLSDIHLCELERSTGLWMRYRQPAYGPDDDIARMLARLRDEVRGDELELVLNGDVFDFDAPRSVGETSEFHDLPRSAEHTRPMLEAVLADHPVVVDAFAAVLADGHRLTFIAGNHDVQLTLAELRETLRSRLVDAALARAPGLARPDVEARVRFRSWFHRTDDGIVIEHGSQYDAYCSYRYPMAPFGREPDVIQPTMGSLAARLLTSRMGFFNPHVDSSFMLTTWGYARHWLERYALSRRSLAASWFFGAIRAVVELWRVRQRESRARRRANIAAAARETGAAVLSVARHARLFARPAEEGLFRVLRELWLDRLLLGAVLAVTLIAWLIVAKGLALALALIAPLVFLAYELLVPKPPLDTTWAAVQRAARRVGRIHRARAVVFGHTHRPEGAWEDGVFFGNSGSWSAAYKDIACTEPVETAKPLIWLKNQSGTLAGGLTRWSREGGFRA